MQQYTVLKELHLPSGVILEPGDVSDKIPGGDIRWLVEQKCIKAVPSVDTTSDKEGEVNANVPSR